MSKHSRKSGGGWESTEEYLAKRNKEAASMPAIPPEEMGELISQPAPVDTAVPVSGRAEVAFTKWHEFFVFVVLPTVVVLIFHPSMLVLWIVLALPAGALSHLAWQVLNPPASLKIPLTLGVTALYSVIAFHYIQKDKSEQREAALTGVYQHLRITVLQSTSSDPFQAIFSYDYDGQEKISRHQMFCYVNSFIYSRNIHEANNFGIDPMSQQFSLQSGGDSDSTKCNPGAEIPDDYPTCGDITIGIAYEALGVVRFKKTRYLLRNTGAGLAWLGTPLDSDHECV